MTTLLQATLASTLWAFYPLVRDVISPYLTLQQLHMHSRLFNAMHNFNGLHSQQQVFIVNLFLLKWCACRPKGAV